MREGFLREPGTLTPCPNHAGGIGRRRHGLLGRSVRVVSPAHKMLVCPDIRVSSNVSDLMATRLLLFHRLGSGRRLPRLEDPKRGAHLQVRRVRHQIGGCPELIEQEVGERPAQTENGDHHGASTATTHTKRGIVNPPPVVTVATEAA